jgi:hypothetical protein
VASAEEIWVVGQYGEMGQVDSAYVSKEMAEKAIGGSRDPGHFGEPVSITLHRPDLRPIYGGPTLLEALWAEMDRLMEALMTGVTNDEDLCGRKDCGDLSAFPCEHEDNGDKYRAQELAWVIAIVTNPYDPSMDQVRAEAMRRWEESQREAEDV